MRICAFVHCSKSTYQLKKWQRTVCGSHSIQHSDCPCPPPFALFPFPTELANPENRIEWTKAVNRKDPVTGKNWQASEDSRICSSHFVDGKPTELYPNPSINLKPQEDNDEIPKPKRRPPRKRKQTEDKSLKQNESQTKSIIANDTCLSAVAEDTTKKNK
eukprot:gene4123-4677_t